ncbi:MAG: CPBP family intramembrane metalloprotease [Dehalococcoidales bacterium]|nr:MAG: CPBP family intramembrane metalloprotease [Dehalococcoidales bacterium]
MKEALIYFLAITISEVITVTVAPLWGIVCHIVVLIALILHSVLVGRQSLQRLLISLALVPLIRIVSLSVPLANIPRAWWYPIIYTPLLIAALEVVRITGYPLKQIGLAVNKVPVQLTVATSGIAIGVVEYFILKPEPMISEFTWQEILLPALIFLLFTGFVEEFIFRGVLQNTALEEYGNWGIIYISLLFAIVHMIHYSALDIAFVFTVAVYFGWVVKKTGSLLGVSLAHGIANSILYLVVPFFF